jgi:hypothetical protein
MAARAAIIAILVPLLLAFVLCTGRPAQAVPRFRT